MLFDHLNKFSKRTALISENLEKLSYSGLISRADKIGSQVSKKSLVFILCENNIDSIVAYVGFIRSGNTVCLFDQNINDELLKRIINLYQPSFIFSNKNVYKTLFTLRAGLQSVVFCIRPPPSVRDLKFN